MALLAVGCGGGGGGSTAGPGPTPTSLSPGVVFISGDGRLDVSFSRLDGTGAIKLFGEALSAEAMPIVTKDGKRVFFTSDVGGKVSEIYSVSFDGSDLQKHSNVFPKGAYTPAVSNNGLKIAFTKPMGADNLHQLFTINMDGSGETQILDRPLQHGDPIWSQDDSELFFVSATSTAVGTKDGLLALNLSRGTLRVLYDASQVRRAGNVAISPDGSRLAFVADFGGFNNLFVINSDGTGLARLTGDTFQKDRVAWTGDSLKVRYTADGPVSGLFEIAASGGTPQRIGELMGREMIWFDGPQE